MGTLLGNKGLSSLESHVIKKGICTMCGACVSLCPYLKSRQGRIVKLHDCDLPEGRCFAFCPRSEVDLDSIHRSVFHKSCSALEVGEVRRMFMARATDPEIKRKAQTGGVVSALISFALEKGMIDAALLTRRGEDQMPEGFVARSREEVLACAGSSYVAASSLEALNREPWKDDESIAIVGLPCQVLASAKMSAYFSEKSGLRSRVSLVVGLFCTWALVYGPFLKFVQDRVKGARILGMDISPPPESLLRVRTSNKTWEIPLEDIRKFIRPGCSLCLDLTSELADVSIGTAEGIDGWNTVIVRTAHGEEVLLLAEGAGIIETRPLPEANWKHLKEASLLKKRRALLSLRERGELEQGYIVLPPEWVEKILQESTEGLLS